MGGNGGNPVDKPVAPEGIDDNAPLTLKSIQMLLNSLQEVLLDKVDKKISEHISIKTSTSTTESPHSKPPNEMDLDRVDLDAEALKKAKAIDEGSNKSQSRGGGGLYSEVAPPPSYNPRHHLLPPMYNQGTPPMLTSTNYVDWFHLMRTHFKSTSTELWRIVQEGYYVHDPRNMTPREYVDDQLNENAIGILQKALSPEYRTYVRGVESARDAWKIIGDHFDNNESVKKSKFEVVLNEVKNFYMKDGEVPDELYRRVITLGAKMKDHGSRDINDEWIKRLFIEAITPHREIHASMIRQRTDYYNLTPSQVMGEFVAMDILKKTSEENLIRAKYLSQHSNLALKANVTSTPTPSEAPQQEEVEITEENCNYEFNDHMNLAAQAFWKNKKFVKTNTFNPNNYNANNYNNYKGASSSKPKGQRSRKCFNCGNNDHFVAECPYEKREENGGRLVLKGKTKSSFNKKPTKKRQPRMLLVQEEYTSGEEDDDEEESTERANIAIAPSLPSLFDAPNENKNHSPKCLMAKTSSVIPPPTKHVITTSLSLFDCVEESSVVKQNLNEFEIFMASLEGETKRRFEDLLEKLGEAQAIIAEHDELMDEKVRLECEAAHEIAELNEALEDEQANREAIEESLTKELSKVKDSYDNAISLTNEYCAKIGNIEDGHSRLLEDFDKLGKDHKSLTSEYKSLKESCDHLLYSLVKELISNDKDASTNPCCKHTSMIEENARLKAQLEKGLATCIQGEKNLHDLLNDHRKAFGLEGIGYNPNEKSNNKKKAKAPPRTNISFVKEGEAAKEKPKNKKGGKATYDNSAGDFNPSYVLCRTNDGHVYAKFVGSPYEYVHWSIWVPKTLVANAKGPIQKWVPKTKG